MPTYSYACTECGHNFDAVQSFTDANLTECPACSGKLRKLFNSVGIVFKGSGFYRTDSRAGAVRAAEKADKGGDSAPQTDGAKTDGAKKDGAKKDGARKDPGKKSEPAKTSTREKAKAG
ncbi:MAG: FmdB family zinc ribbon protein [Mycobacteriaceae bacterium]